MSLFIAGEEDDWVGADQQFRDYLEKMARKKRRQSQTK